MLETKKIEKKVLGYSRHCNLADSDVISALDYDPVSKKLKVFFTNNSIWEYTDVPGPVFGSLVSSESVGSAYNSLIKSVSPGVRLYPLETNVVAT